MGIETLETSDVRGATGPRGEGVGGTALRAPDCEPVYRWTKDLRIVRDCR